MIKVINLATGAEKYYLYDDPEKAVIAAYAQDQGDYELAHYRKRYAHLVVRGSLSVSCGHWTALIEPKTGKEGAETPTTGAETPQNEGETGTEGHPDP